jgi:hypothetical protein
LRKFCLKRNKKLFQLKMCSGKSIPGLFFQNIIKIIFYR